MAVGSALESIAAHWRLPVVADGLAADDAAAVPAVGPVDVGRHRRQARIDVARVEGFIQGAQQRLALRAGHGQPLSLT
jgi:hypothetical protein